MCRAYLLYISKLQGAMPLHRWLISGLSDCGGKDSILGLSMWDLWWPQRHWDRFFSEYFSFALSLWCCQCSIL